MYEEKNDEKEGYKEFIRKKRSNYSSVSEKKKETNANVAIYLSSRDKME